MADECDQRDNGSVRGAPPTMARPEAPATAVGIGPVVVLISPTGAAHAEALLGALTAEGCRVRPASGLVQDPGDDVLEGADVVLIDVDAGQQVGFDLVREVRRHADLPIVVVSATNDELDAVLALELGADDFVARPVRNRELVARIRAVLRRAPRPGSRAVEPLQGQLDGGDVTVDVERHEVTVRGRLLHLPLREFEVLALLLEHRNRVLTRETIIRRIWGASFKGDPKTLDVHIKRLREKLETDPTNPERIVTIRGVGYRYAADR